MSTARRRGSRAPIPRSAHALSQGALYNVHHEGGRTVYPHRFAHSTEWEKQRRRPIIQEDQLVRIHDKA